MLLFPTSIGLGSSLLQAWDAAPNTTIAENVFALNAVSSADTEYYVLIHFLTKFLDMFDTWFIVTRGKSTQVCCRCGSIGDASPKDGPLACSQLPSVFPAVPERFSDSTTPCEG